MIHEETRVSLRSGIFRFALAFAIFAGITYYIFSPIFRGKTLSDMASLWRVVQDDSLDPASDRFPPYSLATRFTVDSAFELLPRLGITNLVVAPVAPTVGGSWCPPDERLWEGASLSEGDDLVALVVRQERRRTQL